MDLGGLLNSLTFGSIIGGLIFSGVGFVALTYGKRTMNVRMMAIGAALTIYLFFVSDTFWIYVIGSVLTFAAYQAAE
ncbi:MAG: hypothetical protein HKL90_05790 [Elusimicrobia bacterium]|nr:hypothetical protein [Elusimicrobiota bacterium]